MTPLQDLLESTVESGAAPGAAALVARGDEVEIVAVGEVEHDSIVRIASITKPITAAAVMLLVDDGLVSLDDPIARWLPELASPQVVRTPESAIDDVVPAARPITVEDLLTFRAGWGFPSDFSLPAVVELFQKLPVFGTRETPDEWLATLAQVPMLRQPGEAWLYNTCSDIQGVLIARVSGQPLPEFLAERIFEPLGMTDTGFHVPAEKLDRLPPYRGADLAPIDDGLWTEPPIFPVGRRRPRLDARRLAPLRAHAARRRRRAPVAAIGALDDDRPPDAGAAGRRRRCSSRAPAGASAAPSRADGRYGWVGGTGTTAHVAPCDRHRRHPAHAGPDDRADVDAAHARVLGVRLRRLTRSDRLDASARLARSRNTFRSPLVPSVEVRMIAGIPGLAQAGRAQIPVRADLLRHGAQIAAEIFDRRPAPEPVAVVDAVDDKARLEHERVRDHRIVLGIGVLLDVEVLLDRPLRV